MKSEMQTQSMLHQPEKILLFILVLVLLSGLCLFIAELLDMPAKTFGYFIKNPHPTEFCFTTKHNFLTASDKKIVAELSSLIYNRTVRINSAKTTAAKRSRVHKQSVRFGQNFETKPAPVSTNKNLHLSWGEKGYDFEITKDGRVQIHIVGYLVADKSLLYRIALKMHMIASDSRSICYESEPDKKIYLKARALLDTVE